MLRIEPGAHVRISGRPLRSGRPCRVVESGDSGSARRSAARTGFTLIELLVVITILVILAVMTLAVVNFSYTTERVRAAARQVQSYLEGARDRAIYARAPRGVRLLVDADNPRLVSSLAFVSPSEPWTEGYIQMERIDTDSDTIPDTIVQVRGYQTDWNVLFADGLLAPGSRIRIPGDQDGSWYEVASIVSLGTGTNNGIQLVTPYRDAGTSPAGQEVAFLPGSGPTTYQLELPNQVDPDSEVLLPSGTVIDLDASALPPAWRIEDPLIYTSQMDVMFSRRGTVVGAAAARGLIHLYVGQRADAELAEAILGRSGLITTTNFVVPADTIDQETIGERALVSLFTRTGAVMSAPLDNTDSQPDGIADDPFGLAERGEADTR